MTPLRKTCLPTNTPTQPRQTLSQLHLAKLWNVVPGSVSRLLSRFQKIVFQFQLPTRHPMSLWDKGLELTFVAGSRLPSGYTASLWCDNNILYHSNLWRDNGVLCCSSLWRDNGVLCCSNLWRDNGVLCCSNLWRDNGVLCCSNLCRAENYLRLIVVREFELPDDVTDLLRRPLLYYDVCEATQDEKSGSDVAASAAPRRLQKLFDRKKSVPRKSRAFPDHLDLTGSWESRLPLAKDFPLTSSSSDQSLDSGEEWPFPYCGASMRGRQQPGSSFWDSDSSMTEVSQVKKACVPDVAASADSTLNSRMSSSSSNSSQFSFVDETINTRPSSTNRRTLSYSHYLSLHRARPRLTQSDSSSSPITTRSLNHPVPELVLDGTRPTRDHPTSPDIFPADTHVTSPSASESAASTHVASTSLDSWSAGKETCLWFCRLLLRSV